MNDPIDLGSGFSYTFFTWDPDRELNPQYASIPTVEKAGILVWREGEVLGSCWFDTPEVQAIPGEHTTWQLHSLDPLHIEPSIQMYAYDPEQKKTVPSYHGFIREGKWVSA